jgi:Ca2+-binding RTX toxin-like protein
MPVVFLTNGDDDFPATGVDVSGDDNIFAFGGNDRVATGAGNDYIILSDGVDTAYGGAGEDRISGDLDDLFYGGQGIDAALFIFHHLVSDPATGRSLQVEINVGRGSYSVFADGVQRALVDRCERVEVTTGNADDVLKGGAYNDVLTTTGGDDRIFGGAGDDLIGKEWGRYRLDGGEGIDILRVSRPDNGLGTDALVLDGRVGQEKLRCGDLSRGSFEGFERFQIGGTSLGDRIRTGDLADSVTGFGGADLIWANDGDDVIAPDGDSGLALPDQMLGGQDLVYGGKGADRFTFFHTTHSAADAALADVIADFQLKRGFGSGAIDRLDLSGMDAMATGGYNDTFTFIGFDAFSAEGQVRLRQDGADTIVEVNTSGSGGVDMSIRLSGVDSALVEAADFIL